MRAIENALLCLNENSEKTNSSIMIDNSHFSKTLIDVCGIVLSKNLTSSSNDTMVQFPTPKIVLTDTTKRNLHSLALALSLGNPIFLEGPTGSGKTQLVEYFASITGQKGN